MENDAPDPKIADEFAQNLDEKLAALKNCQENRGLFSCLNCEEIFSCQTRAAYVRAVYASMNKNIEGDFDF